MGYTHYWYRKIGATDSVKFCTIIRDFKKLIPEMERLGVHLAGGNGEGDPLLEAHGVSFNGPEKCGHAKNSEICISWPSEMAGGVAGGFDNNKASGRWFAGAVIDKRCCDGDCSYETFFFPRTAELRDYEEREKRPRSFYFCKTAFRPYDLAVNCFLIIAKHHLGDEIEIYSDGDTQHWADGRQLCQTILGYGIGFEIDREKE